MSDTNGNGDDQLFEWMMSGAGITDIPVHCETIDARDVMVPTTATAPDDGTPTAWSAVCGYGNALIPVNGDWRLIVVLEIMATPEVIEAFGSGPGAFIETTWMREMIDGEAVLSFVMATWAETGGSTRRFGVRIPPFVECQYLADSDVFALSLVVLTDDEQEDDDEMVADVLSWFVENDPEIWMRV